MPGLFMDSWSQLAFWKTYITPARYSYDQIPDQTGKIAIVTGANTGLGYATTVALAAHGAHVFLACRSKQRALDAIERCKKEIKTNYPRSPAPKLEFLELDLNDMNNADGIEQQFAVNHMGHFVFTMGLLNRIKESQPSRIVILSSLAHEGTVSSGIDFETLNDSTTCGTGTRYGRSKLATILFAKALTRRLANTEVYVNIVHPGHVATEFGRHFEDSYGKVNGKIFDILTGLVGMTPEAGALTQLYVATSPEIVNKDIRGRYFIPIANEIQVSHFGRDEVLQEKLWTFSEKLVKEKVRA